MFWTHRNLARKVMWGLFWVLLGILILLANHGLLGYDISFSRDWPIVLIAVGVMMLVDLLAWRGDHGARFKRTIRIEREDDQAGPDRGQERSRILKDVEEGRMSADEAAGRLKKL